MERKAYISGPINSPVPGLTHEEAKERFHRCERWINEYLPEWKVVNPLKVGACTDESCGEFDGHTWDCWLRYDLIAMLGCNTIVFLPDWMSSAGATLEAHVARHILLEPFYADGDGRILL